MKRFLQIMGLIILCIALTACRSVDSSTEPRQEVSSYEERIIDANLPVQLKLDCDYGEFEVYNWDRKQVKFEITRRIRGSKKKELLEKQLDKQKIEIQKEEKLISLKGKAGVESADYPDCCVVVRIYVPRRVVEIDCYLVEGQMRFLDDMKCNLKISAKKADVEVNSLEGNIKYIADEGWVRISAGELGKDSGIWTGKGNIFVAAACIEGGEYTMDTGNGMIRLEIPKDMEAVFEYLGADENINSQEITNPARFKLRSGIGKIEVIRK